MNAEILARVQFALTVMFHYIFPPLSIGLGVVMVAIESAYLRTGKEKYKRVAKFWTKVFALTFSMGVATGIVMEFEFGTNWATYSRYVGDVFGSALAAEGVFAFFLESGFLAILLFGWDRVSRTMHFIATLMVCLGAHFSAIWIVVANSWMQTPAGYELEVTENGTRAVITDFWAMVLNPSSLDRLLHVLLGAWLAGAFLVISVSAFYILKRRHREFAQISLRVALGIALFAGAAQALSGKVSAEHVAEQQPMKLAAMEGIYETQREAPMALVGVPDSERRQLKHAMEIPGLLSYLIAGDTQHEVPGLDQIEEDDWPKVAVIFQTYRIMIGLWAMMMLTALLGAWYWWRGSLERQTWLLRLMILSVAFPQIANQAGWITAEMGRYPWIVYGLLRISDGLSKAVVAEQILGSTIMFSTVYLLLLALFLFLLDHKIKRGPDDTDEESPYHAGRELLKEERS
jgi:cytochrome d ubiquinol oxidase subunit I